MHTLNVNIASKTVSIQPKQYAIYVQYVNYALVQFKLKSHFVYILTHLGFEQEFVMYCQFDRFNFLSNSK